jgi:enamine deaminase RidA (YjgF/YER057c/UK114 family)
MAQVSIIRHNPIAIFSNPTEVIVKDDHNNVFRLVEPSGSVGTQYPAEVGSEWFGTIENLNAGLEACGLNWSDVYKTDIMWTTPSTDFDECDERKNAFNAVYGAMIKASTVGPLASNRMARFTHPEGFPDPRALFEVQIKAVKGANVTFSGGTIDYGYWVDHQPSGKTVMHKKGDELIDTLGDDLAVETKFVLEQQFEQQFADKGVDMRKQTAWIEILVAVDLAPDKIWENIETVRALTSEFYGDHPPAGIIYPVSRLPNLRGYIEVQPRMVSGNVEIVRSGERVDGFSTWTALNYGGVTEVMLSAVGGDDAGKMLTTLDERVVEAGGTGLKEDAIFNNAYISAGDDSKANRAWIQEFNGSFSAYYEGNAPAGRTAQFVAGVQQSDHRSGISSRAIFA